MGAQGVWTGSLWLTVEEADVPPAQMQQLLRRHQQGHGAQPLVHRQAVPHAPQRLDRGLGEPGQPRAARHAAAVHGHRSNAVASGTTYPEQAQDVQFNPVGQVVGRFEKMRPSRDVIFEMVEECIEATERMNNLMNQTRGGLRHVSIDRCPVAHGTDFTDPDLIQAGVPLPEFAYLRQNRADVLERPDRRELELRRRRLLDGHPPRGRQGDLVGPRAAGRARRTPPSSSSTVTPSAKDERDIQKQMLLNMDDPHHAKVRGIVSRGVFTPRGVAKIEDALRARANQICIEAKAKGTGNFVEDVACELPLQALADLMGFPQDDRKKIFDWSNQMMAYDDPDFDVDPVVAAAEILGYAYTIGDERKACPADDIITKLVAATEDADTLTSEEFAYFILMLAVAGNETTRNAISHGMHAFLQFPEQWEIYKRERPGDRGRRDRPLGHPGRDVPAHRAWKTPRSAGSR